MKTCATILLMVLMIPFYGCDFDLGERGNGEITTKTYEVDDFSSVNLRGGFEIILKEARSPQVTVSIDDNLMSLIDVNSSGGVLNIDAMEKIRPTDGAKITIEYTRLERLEVSGAAEVNAENIISAREFSLEMSGAGDVDLELDLGRLEINVSGAGSVKLAGMAEEQDIQMSGAGSYEAKDLESKSCTIALSGVGGAEVFATEYLDARISGIGGVEYYGNPSEVKSDISGMGSIKAADDGESM